MARFLFAAGLAICLFSATFALAEDLTGRVGVGLETGFLKLFGGQNDYSNVNNQFTLHLRRGLTPRWTLDLAFKHGWVRPGALRGDDAGLGFDTVLDYATTISQPEVGLLYRLNPGRKFGPYVGFGIGATVWAVKDQIQDGGSGFFASGRTPLVGDTDRDWHHLHDTNFTGSISAGVEWFTSPKFSFNLGARLHRMFGVTRDNIGLQSQIDILGYDEDPIHADKNNGLAEVFLGVNFHFGDSDSDQDGIPNHDDACPNSPEDFDGFEDADGCPDRDNDGDGIPDLQDQCPTSPEDRDGFEDEDGCPEADNDGDGILDTLDKCPDQAEDLDGFQDQDGCPETDNDGDGVPDELDECPGTPIGIEIDESGCPVVEEIKEALTLRGVNFLSGSAELDSNSMSVLREVGRSLAAYPEVRIEVRGHTDSTGSAEVNRDLSYRRALAVRDAFILLGISPERITAVGYGEDYPVGDNQTASGRAFNRRVEVHRTDVP